MVNDRSMNRILHAAARGARIEALSDGHWYGVGGIVIPKDLRTLRIHPADAALEYGPASSALREMSETMEPPTINIDGCGITLWVQENEVEWHCATPLHQSLFLLFLAEALADCGL